MSSHVYRAGPYVLMVLLALIEPLTHLWILGAAPEGAVATGVHTGDSSHHLISMDCFHSGFSSPFSTCLTDDDDRGFSYFAVPIFLLYAILGELARMTGLSNFVFLGIANGVGGFLLLWSVHRFMRRIAPAEANLSFYLYAVGGGIGGIAWLAAWLSGAMIAPGFEAGFYRFAQYELIEGQHLNPVLLMPRFYYTLPMTLGFAALTALVETDRIRCSGHLLFTAILFFFTACINVRLGPFFWAVGVLYLLFESTNDRAYRTRLATMTALPVFLGSFFFAMLLLQHPSYRGNVAGVTQSSVLLLPFLYATAFHWPVLLSWSRRQWITLSAPLRILMTGLGIYLAAYAFVYLGHQLWFGNYWAGGDQRAAIVASDWALLLGLPVAGLALALRKPRTTESVHPTHLHWVGIWFLGLLVVSLLAIGNGWFLQFSPQRGMVLLGVPMALLTAAGLRQLAPYRGRIAMGCLFAGGMTSTVVAATWFQGPQGQNPGQGNFAYLHYEYMSAADARLLKQLPSGTVIVPSWSPIAFGEILVHQGDYQVLGGPGALNLGDQPFGPLQESVNEFFDPSTTWLPRQDFIERYCVDYIYCPDTCPVDEAVLAQFGKIHGTLKKIASEGRGAIFAVDHNRL